jgi:hypothetical protein
MTCLLSILQQLTAQRLALLLKPEQTLCGLLQRKQLCSPRSLLKTWLIKALQCSCQAWQLLCPFTVPHQWTFRHWPRDQEATHPKLCMEVEWQLSCSVATEGSSFGPRLSDMKTWLTVTIRVSQKYFQTCELLPCNLDGSGLWGTGVEPGMYLWPFGELETEAVMTACN